MALVSDLHENILGVPDDADDRRAAAGVAMNVGETFLYDPIERQLKFPRQSAQIRRDVQSDFDPTPLSKAVDVPAERGAKA